MSGDKITELRAFGNPNGRVSWDSEKGMTKKNTVAPLFYSKFKYDKKFKNWNDKKYEEHVKGGSMACHSELLTILFPKTFDKKSFFSSKRLTF